MDGTWAEFSRLKFYGVAEAAGLDVVVVVVVSVEVVPLGLAPGVTVSVFCSQAASNTALARMQMYFFIVRAGRLILG